MDIKQYKQATKDLKVRLTAGDEVGLSYYPNHLTGERIEALAKQAQDTKTKPLVETDEEGQPRLRIEVMYEEYIDHGASILASIDLTEEGRPLPFKTEEQKKKALRNLSYDDIQAIASQVGDDINAPLDTTGTDSSAGQAVKDE